MQFAVDDIGGNEMYGRKRARKIMGKLSCISIGKNKVTVVFDSERNGWFKLIELAACLELSDRHSVITNYVDEGNTKRFAEIYEPPAAESVPRQATSINCTESHLDDPSSIYINEVGMNMLFLKLDTRIARSYLKYVTSQVISKEITNVGGIVNYFRNVSGYLDSNSSPAVKGHFYIATSNSYEQMNIYKIGSTANLSKNLSVYNSCRLVHDYIKYIFISPPFVIYEDIERSVANTLLPHRIGDSKMFRCDYSILFNTYNRIAKSGNYSIL